jgi:phosphotransferase system IIB component
MPFLIITSKGRDYKCLYDKRDQELVSRYHWNLHSKGYAVTTVNGKQILMHRLILGIVDKPEFEVDHRFHNRLDNRRSKIRVCSHSQNLMNSRKLKGKSKLKGVYRDQNKWHAQIMIDGHVTNLGRFRSEATCAKQYDKAARQTFKDFAFTNFPAFTEPEQLSLTL